VSVGLVARPNGSGTVRVTALLDRDAATAVGSSLRTADLRAAGWTIEPTERRSNGSVAMSVTRGFSNPIEAQGLIGEVAPAALKRFTIEQHRGFWRTTTSFKGTIDLSRGVGTFSDPALTSAFGGQPVGVTPAQLEKKYGVPIDRLFGLQVAVKLPGKVVDTNAATTTGDGAVWTPKLGEQMSIRASAREWNAWTVGLLALCALSGVGAVAVGVRARAANKPRRRARTK
jgi:hypothetical protein